LRSIAESVAIDTAFQVLLNTPRKLVEYLEWLPVPFTTPVLVEN
jgi:hypothetical protein